MSGSGSASASETGSAAGGGFGGGDESLVQIRPQRVQLKLRMSMFFKIYF